jgi:hypothetical protein
MPNILQDLIIKDESARLVVDIGIGMQWGYQWMLRQIFPNAEIYGFEICKEWYDAVNPLDDKFHKILRNGEYGYEKIQKGRVDYVLEINSFKDLPDLDDMIASVSIMLRMNGRFISIEGEGDGLSTFEKIPKYLKDYGFSAINQKELPKGFGKKLNGFWGNLEYLTTASRN